MPHALPRRALAAIAASLILIISPVRAQDEVRALWVVRTTLTSPSAISTMVAAAQHGGFNTLLVQVRGRGDAYYQRGIEPRPASLAAQPDFDPLATVIAKAHEAGLQVHAWINVNLVASAAELPARARARRLPAPRVADGPAGARGRVVDGRSAQSRLPWTAGSLRALAVGRGRRPVPFADRAGVGRVYDRRRSRHRTALRHRRRPPRLHPLSDQRLRLQPRHVGGVSRIGRTGARRG